MSNTTDKVEERFKVVEIEKPTTEVLNEVVGEDYSIISINASLGGGHYYVTMVYDPVVITEIYETDEIENEIIPIKKGQH